MPIALSFLKIILITADTCYSISFGCIEEWLNIYIIYRVIPLISLYGT